MAHISGTNRSQLLLLPETVDDYVGPDNAARFIDAFVDSLDLSAASFMRVAPAATGRPGYDEMLLNTHVAMPENVELYKHLGWEETSRGENTSEPMFAHRKNKSA